MTQGLYSAVSGIRANQSRMDVISNNIANVNTLGYKSNSVNFQTVFARTITGGTPPNGLLGGTNPLQVGSGVVVGEIASNWSQGGTQFTGRNTDLMINGNGFFVVERVDTNNGNASTDFYLSRAGNFSLDSQGNLVTSAGNRLRGTSQLNGTGLDTLGRVQIPGVQNSFIITKAVDTTNNNQILNIMYSPENTTAAQMLSDYEDIYNGGAALPAGVELVSVPVELTSFSIGSDGAITATYSNGDRVTVRTDASTITPGNPGASRREIVHLPYEGGSYAANNVTTNDSGGVAQFTGREVFTGGIVGGPPGGDPMEGMQLQLQSATVTNPSGLLYDGANNFIIGANSGQTNFGAPGDGARGSLLAGALESSNVDIAGQFTDMIVTQRGIEASSRVIRSQSEILQTIINNTV